MNRGQIKLCILITAVLIAPFTALADDIYVANSGNQTVSIVDSTTNAITSTVLLPTTYANPALLGVTPQEDYCYVPHYTTNAEVTVGYPTVASVPGNQVSVINLTTATPTVIATIPGIGFGTNTAPFGIDFSADGNYAFISNYLDQSITVIDSNPASATFNTIVTRWALATYISSRNPMYLTINPTTGYGYIACWDPYYTSSEYIVVFDTAAAPPGSTVNPIVGTITIPTGIGGGNQIAKVAVNTAGTAGFSTMFNNFGSASPGYAGIISLSLVPPPGAEAPPPRPIIGGSFCFYGSYDAAYALADTLLVCTVNNTAGSTSYYTTMAFVNPATPTAGTTETTLSTDYGVRARGVCVTRDGNFSYAALFNNPAYTTSVGAVAVVNNSTRTLTQTITGFNQPWGVAISRAIGSRGTGPGDATGPVSNNTSSSEKCFVDSILQPGKIRTLAGSALAFFMAIAAVLFILARKNVI